MMSSHARCTVCLMSTFRDADVWARRGMVCDSCYKMSVMSSDKAAIRASEIVWKLRSIMPKEGGRGPAVED